METTLIARGPVECRVMQHTPGPWAFGSFGRLLVVPVIDGVPQKHDPICDLGLQHFPANTEAYANAELISAAPDLLAALQEVVAISDRKHDAWDKAKAAIAKALGHDA